MATSHPDIEKETATNAVIPQTSASASFGFALQAHDAEHSLPLKRAIRIFPAAILWSICLSSALIMEGFDTILLGSLYASPPFKQKYGQRQPNGSYELTAAWQAGLSNGASVGSILGLWVAGYIADRVGYRKTLIGALGCVVAFVLVAFFASRIEVLLVGEILLGFPWGVFQTMTTAYAAEVCPVNLRAYLTTWVNACWVIGQLLASGVLRAMEGRNDQWSYRIPFGLQWMWPIPIAICIYFAPESPWWLVKHNKLEQAKHVLRRLRKQEESTIEEYEHGIEGTLQIMIKTNAKEKEVQQGTSYLDCFRGTDRRRTEIACMSWLIQILCGGTLMGYSTYFYQQAGLATSEAFTMSLIQYALGLLGVLISWTLMLYHGRRTLYLTGQISLFLFLLLIGILGSIPRASPSTKWAIAALLQIYTFVYDATVGPICYSLVSEIPSTRLRNKTIVLARNSYNVGGIVTNVLSPRMLNPTAWAWGAKAAFFWAGMAALGIGWSWERLPEPEGRSFVELDELFERGVAARRFKGTRVRVFGGEEDERGRGVAEVSGKAES
ncbi:Sugar/inositol transporter [Lophiostoma macrostomum CBS 122681]|uniref:Sugar/inositol transporter n=1 Tax=Lophiostoma macrostomum CBS 122681 TaxID=1314788 RepID=A0A6A6T1H4_9PLEO|nr:Sugar/inositol transporter [Lophiostoma macrostomum CBS 122681]